jgi:hypothetical protein
MSRGAGLEQDIVHTEQSIHRHPIAQYVLPIKNVVAWACSFLWLSMNRTPSTHPSPPVGEKVPGGRLRGIPSVHGPNACLRNGGFP